jgi:phosphoenolpyruvate carboxykinase (ATP)
MLIAGTTFLGEIKKGVFGIVSFVTPRRDALPMHCSAFTYKDTTNLMFGLSGTGKTTLSSDPDYQLISDDEVLWEQDGIQMIETGCYAKSEGLTPETHKTIFDAVELARSKDTLVVENPGVSNARLSYPIDCVENAYHKPQQFDHPNNIFFLTMDAQGVFPPVSKISGNTVRRFFETGYTSQMPGTEAGDNEIKKTFSPCYGSPFMPRSVSVYSNLLMDKVNANKCNVYLINTGMGIDGNRFALDYTRKCVKTAIDVGAEDDSKFCLETLERLID